MKSENGALKAIIDKMDNINTILRNSNTSDDLYYDTIRSISCLKLAELRKGFIDINNFLMEMGKLNFKERLPINDDDSISNYIGTALNFLCEELEEKLIPKHHQIFNLLEELIVIIDVEGLITYCNNSFANSFGLSSASLKGIKLIELIEDDHLKLDIKTKGFLLKEIELHFFYNNKKLISSINIKEFSDPEFSGFVVIGKKK